MSINSYSAANDFEIIRKHFSEENSDSWHWIFYGDSITHGANHTHGWRSFPEIFNERIRWEMKKKLDIVINSAFSGNTTIQLIDSELYPKMVRCFAPDVVFIMIGINDIVRLNDSELYRKNLTELVRTIRADKAIPILQTCMTFQNKPEDPNYVKRYQERPFYNQIIREVACATFPANRLPGVVHHLTVKERFFRNRNIINVGIFMDCRPCRNTLMIFALADFIELAFVCFFNNNALVTALSDYLADVEATMIGEESAVEETSTSAAPVEHTSAEAEAPAPKPASIEMMVMVNGAPITLKGKSSYVFVEVFDYINFDLSHANGRSIVTQLNGRQAQYMEPLTPGDVIEIYWKER